MDLFCAESHLTKREVFLNAMRFQAASLLVTHNGKMWLFERHDTSVSIRPIHGFVVGLIQDDCTYNGDPGKEYTRYIYGIGWNPGEWDTCKWSHFWRTSKLSSAEVFFSMDRLNKFLENLEDHFFNVEQGKEMFWVPVTVENGKAF